MALPLIGAVHVTAASLSLVTGAVQLLRPHRGDSIHRRMGYVYVAAMVVNNVTALTIYRFTGTFNVFHAAAIYSLVSVLLGVRPLLRRPRPLNWGRIHYMWMAWSYVGLAAAGATEFLARVAHVNGWLSALEGTLPVFVLGGFLVSRFAPTMRRRSPAPSA